MSQELPQLNHSVAVEVSAQERAEYLEFAQQVARQAGAATLPYFRQPMVVFNKHDDGRFDPVTDADKAAERVVRDAVAQRYPKHGLFGEEFGAVSGNGLTWVVDSIDGTRAFMTGMVHWGLLLALFDGERPILGVMYQPFTDELFFGDGQSAHYQRGNEPAQPMRVSGRSDVGSAVLGSTGPQLYAEPAEIAQFEQLSGTVKMTRFGGDCYVYAMVAMGFMDLAADPGLQAYDIQALIPIIEGAGGCVTTWSGGDASMGGAVLASSSKELHRQALACLNS